MISDEALVKYANRTKGISRNALEVVYLVIQEMATELLQLREEKRQAVQSIIKTLRHDEITVPGIYLAKTEVGEMIPLTIRADQINLGTVFMGFTYQGPVEWEQTD